MQLLATTAQPEEVSVLYTAVWEQLATLARTSMFDPAHVKLSGSYWPLTTACFLVWSQIGALTTCFVKHC